MGALELDSGSICSLNHSSCIGNDTNICESVATRVAGDSPGQDGNGPFGKVCGGRGRSGRSHKEHDFGVGEWHVSDGVASAAVHVVLWKKENSYRNIEKVSVLL